jgi:lambda repressor-like predicted transcriptional regulator
MTVWNAKVLRARMSELGLSVVDLAWATGLTRQTIHTLLREDFKPLAPSVELLATALALEPADLITRGPKPRSRPAATVAELVARAAQGDARAFEVLPAALCQSSAIDLQAAFGYPASRQLLAAAVDTALTLLDECREDCALRLCQGRLAAMLKSLGRRRPRQAFLFDAGLLSQERLEAATPTPLKRHLVFGAFDLNSFRRHLKCAC